ERQLIDIYHRLVWQKDKRWWPVDTYTDEVSKALALYEDAPEEFEDLCHNALKCGLRNPHGTDPYDFDTYVRIPAQRKRVRLIWEKYRTMRAMTNHKHKCTDLQLRHLFREVHLRGYSTDMMRVVFRRAGEQLNEGDREYNASPTLHTILRRVVRGEY